jgi:hypothetical protein
LESNPVFDYNLFNHELPDNIEEIFVKIWSMDLGGDEFYGQSNILVKDLINKE